MSTDRTRGGDGSSTIQSVERAAQILELFTVSRPRLTLSEITARLGVSKATAHRYAMALRRTNLLRYDPLVGAYTLGPQILTLAAAARSGLPIISVAGPYLEELVRGVNETVVLSVWDGEAPVVVRVDDNAERVVRVSVRAGARLSVTDSAQGRVFCAFLPPGQIPGLPQAIENSKALAEALADINRTGVAVNTPELHGVRTLAAPIFQDDRIVAVIAIIGTMATVPGEPTSPQARALRQMAARLSQALGSGGASIPNGSTNGDRQADAVDHADDSSDSSDAEASKANR